MPPAALDLTEEQAKTLENLRHAYMGEAIPIRTELFALRIELRHLLWDQNVQPQILLIGRGKFSALQARLEELCLVLPGESQVDIYKRAMGTNYLRTVIGHGYGI